jgi:hypothetical protein
MQTKLDPLAVQLMPAPGPQFPQPTPTQVQEQMQMLQQLVTPQQARQALQRMQQQDRQRLALIARSNPTLPQPMDRSAATGKIPLLVRWR